MAEIDVRHVDEIVGRIGCDDAAVIAILQAIQDKWRYLPKAALERVCEITDITPAALTGVSTFYSQFRHRPVGRHIISVCHGTACHVKGADQVTDALRRHLGLSGDNDTDAKGLFTLQKVACLGCCTLAPAVQIEEVTYGHLTAAGVGRMLDDFLELQKRGGLKKSADATSQLEGKDGEIRIGLGSCCISRGSGKVYEAITQTLKQCGINAALKRVGCVGMCHQTPLLEIVPAAGRAHLYAQVEADDVRGIIEKHFKADNWTRKIGNRISRTVDKVLTDRHWEGISRYSIDVRDEPVAAFLDKQKHLATEHYGNLDPTDLDEYLRQGGTKALRRCLKELSGQEVIEQI
ncbi:MAG: NAD(P)H-dependent oxidoreductase subunit E, partial [Phycisphaerae bacterium]|nr:NAD(P)H-dependent oxidoreductase subunit E [Phycisphaerae bacterium]